MQKSDTSQDMQKVFDARWRQLTPSERFLKGLSLIYMSRCMLIAGIQHRMPHLSAAELRQAIIKQLYA